MLRKPKHFPAQEESSPRLSACSIAVSAPLLWFSRWKESLSVAAIC